MEEHSGLLGHMAQANKSSNALLWQNDEGCDDITSRYGEVLCGTSVVQMLLGWLVGQDRSANQEGWRRGWGGRGEARLL